MRIHSFNEFWPLYLHQHQQPGTRLLHFIGTGGGVILVLLALLMMNVWDLFMGVVVGYGLAWYGHFFVEKNRPSTWRHPLYSLRADVVLFWMMLTRGFAFDDATLQRNSLKGKRGV